jgi:hypothetical protein
MKKVKLKRMNSEPNIIKWKEDDENNPITKKVNILEGSWKRKMKTYKRNLAVE